jgi:putative spermidine/putrescine transport system permease protein
LSLGAPPTSAFFRVTLPNIMPGVVSGAIFAFATSFDEVVVALFMTAAEQRTLPVQMFSGIRDQINPTIMAAATLLLALSIVLFFALAVLTRRRAG